jgi:methyl-accepting chemotaxis protein
LQINTHIKDSAQRVKSGVSLVSQAGESITAISDRVGEIADLISGIATGASDQSTGLDEINVGMGQLDNMTQKNAAMVEEAKAAIQVVSTDVTKLKELVSFFQTQKAAASDAQGAQAA